MNKFKQFLFNVFLWVLCGILFWGAIWSIDVKSFWSVILFSISAVLLLPPFKTAIAKKGAPALITGRKTLGTIATLLVLLAISFNGSLITEQEEEKERLAFLESGDAIFLEISGMISSGDLENSALRIKETRDKLASYQLEEDLSENIIAKKLDELDVLQSDAEIFLAKEKRRQVFDATKQSIAEAIGNGDGEDARKLLDNLNTVYANETYFSELKSLELSLINLEADLAEKAAAKAVVTACRNDWRNCADNEALQDHNKTYNIEAKAACRIAAGEIAKYGKPDFGIAAFSTYLEGSDYVKTGKAILIDADARFGNAFGAMVNTEVECIYDLAQGVVIAIDAR